MQGERGGGGTMRRRQPGAPRVREADKRHKNVCQVAPHSASELHKRGYKSPSPCNMMAHETRAEISSGDGRAVRAERARLAPSERHVGNIMWENQTHGPVPSAHDRRDGSSPPLTCQSY